MLRSRGLAALFLAGAFITGALLGFAFEHFRASDRHGSRGRESMSARIARELDLTTRQRASMDSLMEHRRAQMRELYRPLRPKLDSLEKVGRAVSDSTHAQVRKILTPQQQTKWDAMRARARNAYEAARRRGDRIPVPRDGNR